MATNRSIISKWQIPMFTAALALVTMFDAGSGLLRTLETGPGEDRQTKKQPIPAALGAFKCLPYLCISSIDAASAFFFPFSGSGFTSST